MNRDDSALVVHIEEGRIVLESRVRLAARLRCEVAESWRNNGHGSAADELIAERRAEAAAEDAGR